jgi:hypothetical protein
LSLGYSGVRVEDLSGVCEPIRCMWIQRDFSERFAKIAPIKSADLGCQAERRDLYTLCGISNGISLAI